MNFPELELETLARWASDNTFQRCLAMTGEQPVFHLYDGPPFANGLPHYGHLLTGYVKDVVPRYKTMRGFHVPRVFGWDTHGLPAELEAMRQLGLKTTKEVEELGLDKFSEACRTSVLEYTEEWEEQVHRQARWVDFPNGYKTMDLSFMESTMWAFKELHNKGLVYEGFRVLPYCWNDETPLSAHELSMDGDGYREVTSTAMTLGLKLASDDEVLNGAHALLWTTTPWTLPANLLLAVNPTGSYTVLRLANGTRVVLGQESVEKYRQHLGPAEEVACYSGVKLVGARYEPAFPYYTDHHELAHTVQAADWVDMDGSGTGLVHVAPGFGEVDKELCDELGLPAVVPMDPGGRYTGVVSDYVGQRVLEANDRVAKDLQDGAPAVATSVLFVESSAYSHSYPHCWRCGEALVYRGVDSWFVSASKLKDRMLELADEVQWVPEVSGNQFKAWLSQVRDWGVSRNRYWGSPVPVWKSDNDAYPRTDFYGSLEDLEADFGYLPTNPAGQVDLHRPYVDSLTRPNPDDPSGKSTMRRVPEVLDVWFDSGAMPFAQQHYPFENKEVFEASFPADFVVEYVAQCRGWFYTLHVLSTALFDRPAFKTCLSHGVVLGSDGRKMSKKLKNYPPVEDVFNEYGSDAMRWYLMSSPVLRGGNLLVKDSALRTSMGEALTPLASVHRWLELQLERYGYQPDKTDSPNVLDRALTHSFSLYLEHMRNAMDQYNFAEACKVTAEFLEDLNNWWVRASRLRLAEETLTPDGEAALCLLSRLLTDLDKAVAPLLPLATERLWSSLGNSGSVHLQTYPDPTEWARDEDAAASVRDLKDLVGKVASLRKKAGHRQRQPLALLEVQTSEQALTRLEPHRDFLALYCNVKQVTLTVKSQEDKRTLSLLPRVAGPRLGSSMKEVLARAKAGDWTVQDGTVWVAGHALQAGEYEWRATKEQDDSTMEWRGGRVKLDLQLDSSLVEEGFRADLLRLLKDSRKAEGLKSNEEAQGLLECSEANWRRVGDHLPYLQREARVTLSWRPTDEASFAVVLED